jgi:hypothetical protein
MSEESKGQKVKRSKSQSGYFGCNRQFTSVKCRLCHENGSGTKRWNLPKNYDRRILTNSSYERLLVGASDETVG